MMKMPFSLRKRIELTISLGLFLEFLIVTTHSLSINDLNITLFSISMMSIGFIFSIVILIESKFSTKFVNDERLDLFTDQAYLFSVVIGFLSLVQLAICEILFKVSFNALTALTIVIITVFTSFIVITVIQSRL